MHPEWSPQALPFYKAVPCCCILYRQNCHREIILPSWCDSLVRSTDEWRECKEPYLSTESIHLVPPKPGQLLALHPYPYSSQKVSVPTTQIKTDTPTLLARGEPGEGVGKGWAKDVCTKQGTHAHTLKQKTTSRQQTLLYLINSDTQLHPDFL